MSYDVNMEANGLGDQGDRLIKKLYLPAESVTRVSDNCLSFLHSNPDFAEGLREEVERVVGVPVTITGVFERLNK